MIDSDFLLKLAPGTCWRIAGTTDTVFVRILSINSSRLEAEAILVDQEDFTYLSSLIVIVSGKLPWTSVSIEQFECTKFLSKPPNELQ